MIRWARRSACSEPARAPPKRHSTTRPAAGGAARGSAGVVAMSGRLAAGALVLALRGRVRLGVRRVTVVQLDLGRQALASGGQLGVERP